MTLDDAKALLLASGYVFDADDEMPPWTLNMNDTFGWALAFAETIPDDRLIEVAELFQGYGWCGLVYWVSEQHNGMPSEFYDVNRMIEFVRMESAIRKKVPGSTQRAYYQRVYTIGEWGRS